jgi:hypothetical protein
MTADAEVRGGRRASASRVRRSRSRTARGAATAEAMVVLPVLLAVGLGLVWVLSLGVTQVRVVDSAREAARAAARGESESAARAAGRRVAPAGARIRLGVGGDLVTAVVTVEVRGPGGLFRMLPAVTLGHRAEAVAEPR